MKKLKTWQLVLLIIFYPIGIIYFIVWLCNRNKKAAPAGGGKLVEKTSFFTKVVGVTFNNDDGTSRQDIIKGLKVGEDIIFKHIPTTDYPDAIGVFTKSGKQIGHLSQGVAAEIKNDYGFNPMSATVANITGGGEYSYGCNIHIVVYEK